MGATSKHRPGGTVVGKLGPGRYSYRWALTTFEIVYSDDNTLDPNKFGEWDVYRVNKLGTYDEIVGTFATKRAAIERLNVLSFDTDIALAKVTEEHIASMTAQAVQ
jgi:hypothetical protein